MGADWRAQKPARRLHLAVAKRLQEHQQLGKQFAGVALTSHFIACFPQLATGCFQRWDFGLQGQ